MVASYISVIRGKAKTSRRCILPSLVGPLPTRADTGPQLPWSTTESIVVTVMVNVRIFAVPDVVACFLEIMATLSHGHIRPRPRARRWLSRVFSEVGHHPAEVIRAVILIGRRILADRIRVVDASDRAVAPPTSLAVPPASSLPKGVTLHVETLPRGLVAARVVAETAYAETSTAGDTVGCIAKTIRVTSIGLLGPF